MKCLPCAKILFIPIVGMVDTSGAEVFGFFSRSRKVYDTASWHGDHTRGLAVFPAPSRPSMSTLYSLGRTHRSYAPEKRENMYMYMYMYMYF